MTHYRQTNSRLTCAEGNEVMIIARLQDLDNSEIRQEKLMLDGEKSQTSTRKILSTNQLSLCHVNLVPWTSPLASGRGA